MNLSLLKSPASHGHISNIGAAVAPQAETRERRREDRLTRALLATLEDRKSAEIMGLAYLRETPTEAGRRKLLALLAPPRWSGTVRGHIRRRQREEILGGDTVHIGGQVLSRTRARLCALAALSDI